MDRRITFVDPARLFADSFKSTFLDDWSAASLDEMEMYEEGDNLVVRMKVPGFKEANIDISIENDVLMINGKTETKEEEQGKKYYFRELQQESFTKSVRLPLRVEAEKAEAEVENGVLKVVMPKSEDAKPKKVAVRKVGK